MLSLDVIDAATLAQQGPLTLVSWWKPILLFPPILGWAWFVGRVLDKHAARFSLPRKQWNLVHLSVATIAVLVTFILPVPGIAGVFAALSLLVVVLAADIFIFVQLHNKDERTQEGHELKLDFSSIAEAKAKKAEAKQAGFVQLQIVGPGKQKLAVPDKETPEYEIRAKAEEQFIPAAEGRARLFEFAPIDKDSNYAITMTIDGVKQPIEKMAGAQAIKLIDFWKAAAGMDVADRRRKQEKTISIGRGEVWNKPVRVSTIGGKAGPKLSLLIEPAKQVQRKIEDMGFLDSQLEALHQIRDEQGGLVLVAAGPSQGLTTSLYGVTSLHDPYTTIVQTVETDIQCGLEGANQNPFDPQGDGEYSTLVRSILRRDPDFVTVADLPDKDTALEVVRADLKRTRVYIGLRAESAMQAIQGFVKLHGDAKSVADVLRGVTAQKLCRQLCQNCRVAYQPKPEMLQKLGLPADKVKQLYKKGGQVLIKNKPEPCPVCNGSGYFGQMAMFEVYPIGESEREMVAEQDWNGLRAELRKRQLPSIQQVGLRRAVEGRTSLEEITRVTSTAKKPQQQGGRKAAS
ncbi:MAG: ATPase, T2SS/T4P/T4SS family [Planctomycetota bacterium]